MTNCRFSDVKKVNVNYCINHKVPKFYELLLHKSTSNLRKILQICLRGFVNSHPAVYCSFTTPGCHELISRVLPNNAIFLDLYTLYRDSANHVFNLIRVAQKRLENIEFEIPGFKIDITS